MKVVIFGLGSIGQRHARLLLKHFNHELCAFRSRETGEKNALGIPEVCSWDEVRRLSPYIALISNPTNLHIKTAIECAKLGMNLFIEKPVDRGNEKLGELMEIVETKGLSTYVAYCLRFHPVIREMREYLGDRRPLRARAIVSSHLPDWRPGYDYRINYSADEKKGGGVLLELSHEIDSCSYLLGMPSSIRGSYGRLSDLELEYEDYADLVMNCERGVANIHMNFFSKKPERCVHVDLPNSDFVTGDLIRDTLTISENRIEKVRKIEFDRDDMYLEQLRYFFSNVGNKRMMNDLVEASSIFNKLVEFKNSHGR